MKYTTAPIIPSLDLVSSTVLPRSMRCTSTCHCLKTSYNQQYQVTPKSWYCSLMPTSVLILMKHNPSKILAERSISTISITRQLFTPKTLQYRHWGLMITNNWRSKYLHWAEGHCMLLMGNKLLLMILSKRHFRWWSLLGSLLLGSYMKKTSYLSSSWLLN